MTGPAMLAVTIVLLAVGLWLLLPHAWRAARPLGSLCLVMAAGLAISQLRPLGPLPLALAHGATGLVTLGAAAAAIAMRNPVYAAIWFALSLLGVASLLLLSGAQFLGVATIVVYAGAILVTFLFVLMLAHPDGQAKYDRLSWDPLLSATAGALMIAVLSYVVGEVLQGDAAQAPPWAAAVRNPPALQSDVLADQHMAKLGADMFSRRLVSVELAGTLLMAALVGSVAICALIPRGRAGGAAESPAQQPLQSSPASAESGSIASAPAAVALHVPRSPAHV